MAEKNIEVKVGILVAICLGLLIAFIIVIGAVVIAKMRPIAVGDDPELEHILEDIDAHHHPELHPELAGQETIGEGEQR